MWAWREQALAGMDAGIKARPGDPLESKLDEATRRNGELVMENELLHREREAPRPSLRGLHFAESVVDSGPEAKRSCRRLAGLPHPGTHIRLVQKVKRAPAVGFCPYFPNSSQILFCIGVCFEVRSNAQCHSEVFENRL